MLRNRARRLDYIIMR
ncbi:hypothetical protein [Escherichia coli]|nr:hypothetical protein [Escherichia coli]MCQ6979327.1 hypothetical protein [Escherichia coli]MCQ7041129.1 hypothetical protein [Escherichia coli]